ncbi:MAG: InlB B-repeat-containing protein, partial [Candidatus Gallimonas sp.]
GAGLVGGNAGSGDSSASTATEPVRKYFISSVAVGANELTLSLDAKALFGGEGTLTLTLGKDDAGKLTAVALASVVNGETRTNLNAGLGYDAQPAPSVSGSYLNLTGLASLVKTLGLSTTHAVDGEVISGEEQSHEYTLNSNFYIDGTIVMDMSALGLMNINVTIKMVAFSINRDENGVIGVNVRFEYDALKKLGITVINGNSTVDLTGKNGMVYIKRTQTTDSDGKGLATPEIVYRAMPLTNFGKDMFNQIGFLFNMSDTIVDMLASIEFSTVDVIGPDFGTTQKNILSSYTYTQSASGDRWLFAINGATLTGGVFGDMNLTLGADAAGNLRTLGLDTAMSMTGLEMTVTADLTYHNPQGVMDSGVKDVTTDIEQLLEDGMCKKLAEMKEKNWQEVVYIEGKYIGIEYVLAGETIATQNIVIGAGNELYGTVSFPDLTSYDTVAGYEPYWDTDYQDGDPIPDSRIFYAKYRARTYGLTFTSEHEIDGWDYDESAGVWVYRTDYVYASGNPLPFAENERRKIVSFLGADGKTYTSLEGWDTLATSFTAVWEEIEYTVTFEIGGEKTSQTGHYGDTIVYPEASVDGYTFEGWSATPETITGNLTLSAVLVPNTYTVTLVSEYAAEGFELREDGKYSLVLNYTYGTDLELPTCDNTEIGLHLGGYTDEAGTPVYRVKNILSDVVYTAVWEEIGYAITFVDGNGNTVTTLNGHMGETVSARADLPSVPEKTGYTGEWNFGEDTVTGEMTVSPVYTPNEYTVTLVSSQPYGGFTATDGRYEKYLTYTYDTTLSLETLSDIHGFRFTGYFTQADGAGEEVTEICNILADTVIYACWQDNTVTVTLYSDLKFDGSAYDFNANAYGRTYTFNDVYDLTSDYCPNVTGYQQLGFWHESATGWQQVTNVSSLNGESVWMVWIKNIRVTITQFYTSNMLGGSQYNIGGTVEGGAVFGAHSQEIFTAIGATETTTGVYTLYGTSSDSKDELDWGKETTINYDENGVGTFLAEGMNSAKFSGIDAGLIKVEEATYGGLVLTKTFVGGSMSITTTYSAIVSLDTYTVTFVDGNGNAVTSSAVRLDCPFDTDDNATYLDSIGPEEFPTGYGKGWENVAVTGNMTVNAYSPNLYGVTFVSDGEVEGWLYCDGGDYAGKWIYETQMYYDSVVNFYGFGNSLLEEHAYTVGLSNVITLPAVPEYGGKSGSWNPVVSATGASFSAVYELDTVVYRSAVGYTVGGGGTIYSSDNPYMAQLIGDYALVTPVAEGYEFLGWWQQSADGSWTKITSVSVSSGDQAVITTVEALWETGSDLTVSVSASKSLGWGKYTYKASIKVTGGADFVGAFAGEKNGNVSASSSVEYCAGNSVGDPVYYYTTPSFTVGAGAAGTAIQESVSFEKKDVYVRSTMYVVATVTYYYNGTEIYSQIGRGEGDM